MTFYSDKHSIRYDEVLSDYVQTYEEFLCDPCGIELGWSKPYGFIGSKRPKDVNWSPSPFSNSANFSQKCKICKGPT